MAEIFARAASAPASGFDSRGLLADLESDRFDGRDFATDNSPHRDLIENHPPPSWLSAISRKRRAAAPAGT